MDIIIVTIIMRATPFCFIEAPYFTIRPPPTVTVRTHDTADINCAAASPDGNLQPIMTWRRVSCRLWVAGPPIEYVTLWVVGPPIEYVTLYGWQDHP